MKWQSKFLLLFVSLALVACALTGCGGTSNSPEKTISAILEAVESEDAEILSGYFVRVEDEGIAVAEGLFVEDFFAKYEDINIYNVDSDVISKQDDTAVVRIKYVVEVTCQGEQYEQNIDEEIQLVLKDKRWLVNELFAAVLAAGAFPECDDESTPPENTIRGILRAVEAEDAELMAGYFVGAGSEAKDVADDFFATFDDIRIYAVDTEIVSQTEDTAVVRMKYFAKMSWADKQFNQYIDEEIELVLENEKWLVKELFY